jgi:hypothetical protein
MTATTPRKKTILSTFVRVVDETVRSLCPVDQQVMDEALRNPDDKEAAGQFALETKTMFFLKDRINTALNAFQNSPDKCVLDENNQLSRTYSAPGNKTYTHLKQEALEILLYQLPRFAKNNNNYEEAIKIIAKVIACADEIGGEGSRSPVLANRMLSFKDMENEIICTHEGQRKNINNRTKTYNDLGQIACALVFAGLLIMELREHASVKPMTRGTSSHSVKAAASTSSRAFVQRGQSKTDAK